MVITIDAIGFHRSPQIWTVCCIQRWTKSFGPCQVPLWLQGNGQQGLLSAVLAAARAAHPPPVVPGHRRLVRRWKPLPQAQPFQSAHQAVQLRQLHHSGRDDRENTPLLVRLTFGAAHFVLNFLVHRTHLAPRGPRCRVPCLDGLRGKLLQYTSHSVWKVLKDGCVRRLRYHFTVSGVSPRSPAQRFTSQSQREPLTL